MTPLAVFLLTLSVSMLVGLVVVAAVALFRDRSFERQLAEREAQYADALQRERALAERLQQSLEHQARQQYQIVRQDQRYNRRGELIRDLGLDPERLERGRDALLGELAVMRLRAGVLLAAGLETPTLLRLARTAGSLGDSLCDQLDRRLDGTGGVEHDQQARDLLREMIDGQRIQQPLQAGEETQPESDAPPLEKSRASA